MKTESKPTLEGLRLESLELIEDLKVVLGGQAHTATITRCFNDLFDLAYGLDDKYNKLLETSRLLEMRVRSLEATLEDTPPFVWH